MKDLSTVEKSMTSIIQTNHIVLDVCSSVSELADALEQLFAEHDLDTPATKRLLMNVRKKRTFAQALQTVYDSVLYGSNFGVINK